MKNKRRQTSQHISPKFEPNTKSNRSNGMITLFISMALFVTLFFFGYHYYMGIEKSYYHSIEEINWIEKADRLSKNQPTTFLVVGLSFPDGGRIESQQATSWNLITLNPKTGQGLLSQINAQLEIDNKPLYQWNPRHQTDLLLNKLEIILDQNIDHLTVIYLSETKSLIDLFPNITITPQADYTYNDLHLQKNQNTLLSGRLALQYMLNQGEETVSERNQRVNEVLLGIWNEVYGLNHLPHWKTYFDEASQIVYSSLSWQDYLRLNFGSYQKAIKNLTILEVDKDNLEELRTKVKEIIN